MDEEIKCFLTYYKNVLLLDSIRGFVRIGTRVLSNISPQGRKDICKRKVTEVIL